MDCSFPHDISQKFLSVVSTNFITRFLSHPRDRRGILLTPLDSNKRIYSSNISIHESKNPDHSDLWKMLFCVTIGNSELCKRWITFSFTWDLRKIFLSDQLFLLTSCSKSNQNLKDKKIARNLKFEMKFYMIDILNWKEDKK